MEPRYYQELLTLKDSIAWSAPSAIGTAGLGVGGQAGAEMTDFLVVLNSRSVSLPFGLLGCIVWYLADALRPISQLVLCSEFPRATLRLDITSMLTLVTSLCRLWYVTKHTVIVIISDFRVWVQRDHSWLRDL